MQVNATKFATGTVKAKPNSNGFLKHLFELC